MHIFLFMEIHCFLMESMNFLLPVRSPQHELVVCMPLNLHSSLSVSHFNIFSTPRAKWIANDSLLTSKDLQVHRL